MPVCITGMHRSGTSMVAKLMSESGIYLGPPDEIMPAADQNPEGFWENLKFVELNDELLSRQGAGWDCPPPCDADWSKPAIAALRPAAEQLVRDLEPNPPWGWKDPRTVFTLPFWQSVLDHLQVVLVVRNPLEVAQSLRQRNGFSLALGLTLWRLTYERALATIPAEDRVISHYDAYFARPVPEYQRVMAALGLEPAADVIGQLNAGGSIRLRHHRFYERDLIVAGVDRSIVDLYRTLCDEANWTDAAPEDAPSLTVDPDRDLGSFDTIGIGVGNVNRLTMENGFLRRTLDAFQSWHTSSAERRDEHIGKLANILTVQSEAFARARAVEHELLALRQSTAAHQERLDETERLLREALTYEGELRRQLEAAHEQLTYRDAEVMATLGHVLARYAPGAPAAVYYRRLLESVRTHVRELIPAGAAVAVASLGDEAMLQLDGRPAWHFPALDDAASLPYSEPDMDHLLTELEALRERGAKYLVLPASSWTWRARFPNFDYLLESRYTPILADERTCMIYDLRPRAALAAAGRGDSVEDH